MYDFSSPAFWYKLVFAAELMIAEGLATYTLKKKKRFALRVIPSVFAVFAVAFCFPIVHYSAIFSTIIFTVIFACSVGAMKCCYDESLRNIFYCAVIAYTVQHLSCETFKWLSVITGVGNFAAVYDGESDLGINGFMALIYFVVYALIYWFSWAFVYRKIRMGAGDGIKLENGKLMFLSAAIVLVDILLNALIMHNRVVLDDLTNTVIYFYSLISCTLCIGLLFSMLDVKTVQSELKQVQDMWRQDKRMYEFSKKNVELINVKCHDLKKQLRFLRKQDGEVKREMIKDIEKAMDFYDGAVATGSDVLDLVLAEKGVYCTEHGIVLTCIADGKQLGFIKDVDLYSMLINAVDNAIEAVEKYDDPEKKFIRVHVAKKEMFVSVCVENWLDDPSGLVLGKDGLPETDKSDKDHHGFGLKSIRLHAQKYGGTMTVSVADKNLFSLNILIPLQRREAEDEE